MAKIMGNDLVTQEEFDTFKDRQFEALKVKLNAVQEAADKRINTAFGVAIVIAVLSLALHFIK